MPIQTCPKCGKFHYVPGDCPAPRAASAAASTPAAGSPVGKLGASRRATTDGPIAIPAKADATPKATKKSARTATSRQPRVQKPAAGDPQSDPPPVSPIKRGRGRPPGPIPFDKKAHDRLKSAERRAAKKAEAKPK